MEKIPVERRSSVSRAKPFLMDSRALHTKTPSQETKIRSLSGGNQQKVILGRWLLTDPDVLFQAGNDRILPDIQDGENTGRAALLRQQGKAVFDGLARIAVAAGLAVEGDGAVLAGHHAEDALERLRAAAAVQTGQAEDLAAARREVHIAQAVILARQVLDLQEGPRSWQIQ